MSWRVLKFGGSSVGSSCGLQALLQIIAASRRSADRSLVVVSALAGVTDQLQALALAPEQHPGVLAALRERHLQLLTAFADGAAADWATEQIEIQWRTALALLQDRRSALSDSEQAQLLACGERSSAPLLTAALLSAGQEAVFIDACELLQAQGPVLDAVPLTNAACSQANRTAGHALLRDAAIAVTTGFIATDAQGGLCLLGRGGSDTSATALAALLGAERVEIWTDVDGVADADPACVPDARLIRHLSPASAQRLASEGAKVLHDRSLQPAWQAGIPIHVRNTFRPDSPGTWIAEDSAASGFAALIGPVYQQGRARLSWVGDDPHGFDLQASLREAGHVLLAASREPGLQRVWLQPEMAIAALQLAHKALGAQQRAAERVQAEGASKSVASIRMARPSGPETLAVSIAGARGQVATALLAQWNDLSGSAGFAMPALQIVRGFDRHGYAEALSGMAPASLAARMADTAPRCWSSIRTDLLGTSKRRQILLDLTASAELASSYAELMAAGVAVVTANKLAFSGSQSDYARLADLALTVAPLAHETTVAAAVPVLQGLRDLRARGETVTRLRAVLSGSLSHVLAQLHQGVRFSEAVRQARDLGYTEAHPGEDLSLADVRRKLLIMLRESGLQLEPEQIDARPLTADLDPDVQSWLGRLSEHDDHWEQLCRQALGKRQRLVVIAQWDGQKATVGLQSVAEDEPMARLGAGENRIEVQTQWHDELALVFAGPGAGPKVTAAGVWGDLLRVADQLVATRVSRHDVPIGATPVPERLRSATASPSPSPPTPLPPGERGAKFLSSQ